MPANRVHQLPSTWDARAQAVADFAAEHERLPYRTRDPRSPEHGLADWLHKQRHRQRLGQLPQQRSAHLDALVPGWRVPQRDRDLDRGWSETCAAVAEFVRTSRRLPRVPRADVTDPVERRLGRWLATQRDAVLAGRLPLTRQRQLDHEVPGWNPARGRRGPGVSEEWLAVAYDYADWLDDHDGALPRRRSDDRGERRLANWARQQRVDYGKGALHPARAQWLERFLPRVLGAAQP
ncbi:MAG: helicase associated domain-containing protein [Microbacteriaceae bacterium]